MRRILLVDDEIIIVTQLEEQLMQMGYDIVGMASSGREAVDMARALLPELILMDVVMPGELDGIAAAECIRRELGIPFIFMTAYTDHDIIQRAKSLEPLGYILKPFQDGQITAAIEIALHNDAMARRLRESEDRYRNLVEIIPHGIMETDAELRLLFANPACHRMFEFPTGGMAGMRISDLLPSREEMERFREKARLLAEKQPSPVTWDLRCRSRSGRILDTRVSWSHKLDEQGGLIGFIAVVTDVTEQLRFEKALRRAHKDLEERVEQRTQELLGANTRLKMEIRERKRAERELETKRANLEEVNTALKVLLKKRDENRLEMEEKVLLNMKELALPYLARLRQTPLDPTQEAYMEILESNLNDIISPFSKRLSSRFWNFTPAEIKIANLIKQGKTTKEIAAMLNLSPKTVETHRKNIRKKLSIGGKKTNLRSHLLSIQ
ncbi:MAG: response regulator [Deltaproteobacteria bacterium]|nr:response regulator [Deltaproteobacteria bacterium]